MRSTFIQYFRPTREELETVWRDGLFAFDASVLLNVYGYSDETRKELVRFVERNRTRVRLTHQFAFEYARNRCNVIVRQISNYTKMEQELKQIEIKYLTPKRDHPFLSADSMRGYAAILHELAERRRQIENLIASDPYADRLLSVFDAKVGPAPSPEELAELHRVAAERYARQIPPGYADQANKAPPDCYGDFIGWRQLITLAKAEQKQVIFVIDDFKGDWWQIEQGRMIGPRPELLDEFSRESNQRVYLYTSERFLQVATEMKVAEISPAVLAEISQRLESRRQTQLEGDTADMSAEKMVVASGDPTVTAAEKNTSSPKSVPVVRDTEEKAKVTPAPEARE